MRQAGEARTEPARSSAGRPTRVGVAAVAAVVLWLTGCEAEDPDAVPPPVPAAMAEVVEPGGRDLGEAYPITAEDVGDLVLASGVVVGDPGPEGFFLQTEGGQVILVRSPRETRPGQMVRAVGPVRAATVALFEGWQRELLGEPEPAWELITSYYIAADRVVALSVP